MGTPAPLLSATTLRWNLEHERSVGSSLPSLIWGRDWLIQLQMTLSLRAVHLFSTAS